MGHRASPRGGVCAKGVTACHSPVSCNGLARAGGRTRITHGSRLPTNPSPISIPPCVILTDFAAAEEDIQLKSDGVTELVSRSCPCLAYRGFSRERACRALVATRGVARGVLVFWQRPVPSRSGRRNPFQKQQTERRNTTWPRFSESTSERPTAAWPSWKAASPSSSPTRRATARRPPSSRSPSPASASSARPPSARPSPTPRTPSSRSSASWAAATTRWPTRSRRSPTRSSAPPTATPR